MKTFTSEERNLMYLYNSGTRLELIDNLTDMRSYLQADETELLTLRTHKARGPERCCHLPYISFRPVW